MRATVGKSYVKLWLSANDTYNWAHREGAAWPGSKLSGERLFAEFDANGLVDMTINGRSADCDANEFNAITADALADYLTEEHPCYFVCVGQFKQVAK